MVKGINTMLVFALAAAIIGTCSAICTDTSGWADQHGISCSHYSLFQWCADGTYGPGWGSNGMISGLTFADRASADGVTPNQACCACGKPDDAIATATTSGTTNTCSVGNTALSLPAGWEQKNWALINIKETKVFVI